MFFDFNVLGKKDTNGCIGHDICCYRGALMDDAMIISCGHSVGNSGLRRVMETVSSIFWTKETDYHDTLELYRIKVWKISKS